MTQISPKHNSKLITIFNVTILAAYFHVFMEWLFFVTKSSYLSTLSWFEKVKVLFVCGGMFALVLLALLIILCVPAWLIKNSTWKARLLILRYIPVTFMLSVTALILLDNFTYTLFKFGVTSTYQAWRLIYTGIFTLIFLWMFRYVRRNSPTFWKHASFLTFGLLAVSMTGIFTVYSSRAPYFSGFSVKSRQQSAEHPNIIILGSDGLSAEYLSVYNNELDTTPFISQLAKTSLVAENAFSNASSTTASTASILTGREPAEVDVYRYPDILNDEDSFEHLPSILKHQGYHTVELGTPYYVDAVRLNMLDGFDIVNNQSTSQPALNALRSILGNSSSTYFTQMIAERSIERLLHISFIKEMDNPLEQVNDPNARMTDTERVDQIIDLMKKSRRPVFVFAHFMDTHGPAFSSEKSNSTADESSGKQLKWDVDRYEESILSFDDHVKQIYTYLAESGKLDNTILVIYTDHGFKYVVKQRIPIIIHFPHGTHTGTRKNNVQVIDIPVTLLDYLGIAKPQWMTGWSMLGEEPPADRQLISITAGSPRLINPPFYQIKMVQIIVCHRWYELNVQENAWDSGDIEGHTAPCTDNPPPPDEQIRPVILKYLEDHEYDIDSIR